MTQRLWQSLLQAALTTEEYEISCLECFDLLDHYADLIIAGADLYEIMPAVRQHLNNCPTCTDEFETLMFMLQEAVKSQQSSMNS
jgi:hypothetical protein